MTLSELVDLGAPLRSAVLTAAFISKLDLSGKQKARLLRDYLFLSGKRLTREVLIQARDYSFYL